MEQGANGSSCHTPGAPPASQPSPHAGFVSNHKLEAPHRQGLSVPAGILAALLLFGQAPLSLLYHFKNNMPPSHLSGYYQAAGQKRTHSSCLVGHRSLGLRNHRWNKQAGGGQGNGFSLKSIFVTCFHHETSKGSQSSMVTSPEARIYLFPAEFPGSYRVALLKLGRSCRSLESLSESLIQQLWGGAGDPTFLTDSQGFPGSAL